MGVQITDNNNVPNLIQTLNELNRRKIKIGIFGGANSQILMIATVNEFGTSIHAKKLSLFNSTTK